MSRYKQASHYLDRAIFHRVELFEKAIEVLGNVDFDTIVGRGLSGALVIPTLADKMGKHFAIVRKSGDSLHREFAIEGTVGDKWIFVDDFVATGRTRREVITEISDGIRGTEYVGTYQYIYGRYNSKEAYHLA